MEGVKVRLQLAGRRIYEQPIPLTLQGRLPKVGDLIEVAIAGRMVRAQVTSTSSPICRGDDLVTYLLFAREAESNATLCDPVGLA